jgi:hypothetical protein
MCTMEVHGRTFCPYKQDHTVEAKTKKTGLAPCSENLPRSGLVQRFCCGVRGFCVRLKAQCSAWSFVMGPHPNDFNNFFVIKYLIDQSMMYIYSSGKGTG